MPDGLDPDTQPMPVTVGASAKGWVLGGRYRVMDRVGTGGMAEVFRAHDDLLDRDVAVKAFRTMLDDPDGSTNGPARRELELQALARLNHPNLITLYDGSVAGDGPAYLVLEFVDGPDLASRLKDGPLPEFEVRQIGAQIADALAYVHAHGLVHRDVKPANILIGSEDGLPGRVRARLSDFGIVRMVGSPAMTSADLTVGTAYYIAPEQARGSAVGPEADVYALGLVLLESLTGRRAFDGPMHEALAARLTTDPPIPADLPAPWPAVLAAMTAQDPAARPSAADVAQQLHGTDLTLPVMADAPTSALAPLPPGAVAAAPAATATVAAMAAPAAVDLTSAPSHAHRRRRRIGPWLLLAALVAALAVGLGLFLAQGNPSGSPTGPGPTTSSHPGGATHSSAHTHGPQQVGNVGTTAPVHRHTSSHRATPSHSSTHATQPGGGQNPGPSTSNAPSTSSSAPGAGSSTPASSPSPGGTDTAGATSSAAAQDNTSPAGSGGP